MKKIENLNDPIQLVIVKEADKAVKGPTIKDILLVELSMTRKMSTQKMRLYKIGMDLMNAQDSIELEDSDFKILHDLLNGPDLGHPDFLIGGVLAKFEEIEKKA